MLDKGEIVVYYFANNGLNESSSGCSLVVKRQLPKLDTRVRFSVPAFLILSLAVHVL